MYQTHIAYIDLELLSAFDSACAVPNFSAWIREQARRDFDLIITSQYELSLLDEYVREHYYLDKTEWLREKLRVAIRESLNRRDSCMEKQIINVTTIEVVDTDKLGDIALQALNIKREGGIIDIYFIPDSNALRVKYLPDNNNLEDVLASWGKTLYTDKEVYITLNTDDVKDVVRNDINKEFEESAQDGFTGDITFNFEE